MSTRTAPSGPWRLTLVTNPDDCTLACDMCPCGVARASPPGRVGEARPAPRRMSPALARSVLAEQRGGSLREIIPSTMGEPLLWPGLAGLLDDCAAARLRVNLTTNGTFPGRGAEAWGEALLPVASDVKISWNGATAATAEALMPGLDFSRAVDAVRRFVAVRDRLAGVRRTSRGPGWRPAAEATARRRISDGPGSRRISDGPGSRRISDGPGLRRISDGPGLRRISDGPGLRRASVSFQVTAQEGNVGELAGIVRLAAQLGVDRVKLNHLQPRFPWLAERALTRSAEAIARWNAAAAAALAAAEEARRAGAPLVVQNAVPLAPDPAAPAPAGPCPFAGREAWLAWDGRLLPCPHPAAGEGAFGDLGSVAEAPLGVLWRGEAFRRFLAGVPEHPVCRACRFRRIGGA